MKDLHLINVYEWEDSNYFATLDKSHYVVSSDLKIKTFQFDNEEQYIFFQCSKPYVQILYSSVKIFNTFEEVSAYVQSLLLPNQFLDISFVVSTIKELIARNSDSDSDDDYDD